MGLKAEVLAVASEMHDEAGRLTHEGLAISEVPMIGERLEAYANRLENLAAVIPSRIPSEGSPAAGIAEVLLTALRRRAGGDENGAENTGADEPQPRQPKIGRRDRNGRKLREGDIVGISDSERYGSPTGEVTGPGPDLGDGKERVAVKLHDDLDDHYTPSCERVTLLARAGDAERVLSLNGPLVIGITVGPDGISVRPVHEDEFRAAVS